MAQPPTSDPVVLDLSGLDELIRAMASDGYQVIGPTVRDNAIILDTIDSVDDLPSGWGVESAPGLYRLQRRDDEARFGHSAGPQSWKQYLHPARRELWSWSDGEFHRPSAEAPRYAFIGVRGCDLAAIGILRRVLGAGAHPDGSFTGISRQLFIVAANCTEPGGVCFCASMGTGPEVGPGYDIALTEQIDDSGHRFVTVAGSDDGARILAALPHRLASSSEQADAQAEVTAAASRMGRQVPPVDLPRLIEASRDSEHWNDVADRCLSCGNCTMVCPTCFCTTSEDVSDLTGDNAGRWQRWASCFELDYSYIHGGSVRVFDRQPVPPVDQSQARHLARPVRKLGLRRLWPLHRLVSGRHRHHRRAHRAQRPGHGTAAGRAVIDVCELSTVPLLADLSDEQLQQLASTGHAVTLQAGHRLFREGEPAHGCWLLHDGRVALDITVPGRGQLVVQTLGRGDVLGWSWLVPPHRWHFSAVVLQTVACHRNWTPPCSATSLTATRASDYPLTQGLFTAVVQRLQSTRARLLDLYGSPHDALRRLAAPTTGRARSAVPVPYRVIERTVETHDSVTLRLEPEVAPLPAFRPGQFTMLTAPGSARSPSRSAEIRPRPGRNASSIPSARRRRQPRPARCAAGNLPRRPRAVRNELGPGLRRRA